MEIYGKPLEWKWMLGNPFSRLDKFHFSVQKRSFPGKLWKVFQLFLKESKNIKTSEIIETFFVPLH